MSTVSYAVSDSMTMLRRNLKRMMRYPSMTLLIIGMPIVFLLLFVYVFGGTLGAGIGGLVGGRAEYVKYVAPGILVMTVASGVQGTAISMAMDMTEGIIARFKTMAIYRASVLTGHVVGSVIQTMIGVVVVFGVALLIGFRTATGPLDLVAAFGLMVLIAFALTWLSVGLGLAAKSVETASNTPMFLILLPFLGSGFVPTGSMPAAVRYFAEYQPFTPVIETLRGLLLGTPMGDNGLLAIGWCVVIAVPAYLWAKRLYNNHAVR
ncbi:MAG TPA: ABC transporter permease [Pseudonocardiaceae bacterium]|jgi:ABC-2 type transport system permease protein|nr:ABC transporter permease [Pseudonocardiaceae bacterium]